MEPDIAVAVAPPQSASAVPMLCPVCHQPILPTYYFCPNCGANLHPAPLPTGVWTQIVLYAFSIILPWLAYLFITRWQGVKYVKSTDPKARWIGIIAWVLLILSSVLTVYLAIVWTEDAIQSSVSSINSDFSD